MFIPFTKLHGNGNDFVLIDEMETGIIPDDMKADFAKAYCDRKFGIGADGILYLMKPEAKDADVKMRLFQPDGSEAAMCGNGIRCLAKYAYDHQYTPDAAFRVETGAGVLIVRGGYTGEHEYQVSIDMGTPKSGDDAVIGKNTVSLINTGVPHAVVFVDDIESVDIGSVAPEIRHYRGYPEGANVNFVQVTGNDSITIRTFERGVEDETLSCGTGATASALISAAKQKVTASIIHVTTVGGPLDIDISGKSPIMTGPAETVFSGEIEF